ncbi:hypothetical protein SMICM304S_00386 [Streptomyces microflavus]
MTTPSDSSGVPERSPLRNADDRTRRRGGWGSTVPSRQAGMGQPFGVRLLRGQVRGAGVGVADGLVKHFALLVTHGLGHSERAELLPVVAAGGAASIAWPAKRSSWRRVTRPSLQRRLNWQSSRLPDSIRWYCLGSIPSGAQRAASCSSWEVRASQSIWMRESVASMVCLCCRSFWTRWATPTAATDAAAMRTALLVFMGCNSPFGRCCPASAEEGQRVRLPGICSRRACSVSAPDPQPGRRRTAGRSSRGVQVRIDRGARAPFPQSVVLRGRDADAAYWGNPASAVRPWHSSRPYGGVQKVRCGQTTRSW